MQQNDFPLVVLAGTLLLAAITALNPAWISSAAFWTALFTAALTVSSIELWRETKKSADAAMLSAKSLATAERAYVKLSHWPPGVQWRGAIAAQAVFVVGIRVKNFGDTPARITDVVLTWTYRAHDQKLPETPNYDITNRGTPPTHAFLVRNDEYTHQQAFKMSHARKQEIELETTKLIILGYVDYIDTFGDRHRAGYAREYDHGVDVLSPDDKDRNNLPFVIQRNYNYDRLRVRGEGLDWKD